MLDAIIKAQGFYMALSSTQIAESLRVALVQSLAGGVETSGDIVERRASLEQIGRRLRALLQHAPSPEGQTTEILLQRARLAAQIEAALSDLYSATLDS